jgi:two-component system, OmpR family, sensor histidine kinase MtrB
MAGEEEPAARPEPEATGRSPSSDGRPTERRPKLSRRLGLRARVTAAFTIGAFVLSTLMAGITYFTARQTLLSDRESAMQRQAFANASLLQSALRAPGTQVSELIGSVDTLPGSLSVLYTGGQWYATSISVSQNAIPSAERSRVLSGTPASEIFVLASTPELVIGVPLPAVSSSYFEVFSLAELAGTLRDLAYALAGAALVTTLAGAALGRWASSRALRPLGDITDAAVAIAGGDLDTRVDARDDVDLQELASAFNRMTSNLQDRIEREARFTSDVSHELRSPLTTLSATVGVLEAHRDELDQRAQSALDLLDADLRRFTRMVDELLEISRFDAGSAELSLDEVDPRELVVQAVTTSSPGSSTGAEDRPRATPFPVEVGEGVDGLRLRVDKRRFERVMTNLVDNATLYAGGVSRVVVERWPAVDGTGEDARSIRVIVEDRGPVISPRERPHLFERFYRGGRAGQRESGHGTGLGLALVAEHVRLHGGRVWSEPGPDRGNRFVVELPLEAATSPDGALGEDGTGSTGRAVGNGRRGGPSAEVVS